MNPLDPVRHAAAAFRLQGTEITRIEGGFSGARIWKVLDRGGRAYALRLLPTVDRRQAVRLPQLCHWMETLHESGMTVVPRPLRSSAQGQSAATGGAMWLHHSSAGVWMAETWMPGTAVAALPSTATVRQLAGILRSIHESGRRLAWTAGAADAVCSVREGPSPAVCRRVRIIEELLQGRIRLLQEEVSGEPDAELRELLTSLLRRLPAALTQLSGRLRQEADQTFQLQPVLRDLWYPHVLFAEDHVSGIVDWQAFDMDHPVLDVARLLRSWCRTDALAFDRGLRIFAEEWGLGVRELRLLRLLDQSAVLLSPLTWLQGRYRNVRQRNSDEPASRRLLELVQVALWSCAEPWV